MKVREIMKNNPAVIDSKKSIDDAVELMKKTNSNIVIVCEDRKPVGIITEKEISRTGDSRPDLERNRFDMEIGRFSFDQPDLEAYSDFSLPEDIRNKANLYGIPF